MTDASESIDNDPNKPPEDPLIALEKANTAKHNVETVVKPRIAALQDLSEHYNADPYALSSKLRKTFREDKKVQKRKREMDDEFKSRYSLPEEMTLVPDDDVREEAKEAWNSGKKTFDRHVADKRRALEIEVGSTPVARALGVAAGSSSLGSSSGRLSLPSRIATSKPALSKPSLASTLLLNSLRRSDPFLSHDTGSSRSSKSKPPGLIVRK